MLERYFVRPQTVDRIRASWLGPAIEEYVTWLTGRGYAPRNVFRRVPILVHFGEFARTRGAKTVEELPGYVEAFGRQWVEERGRGTEEARRKLAGDARTPVEQMLRLVVAEFTGTGRRRRRAPFEELAPDFFEYLQAERGLRPASICGYKHHLLPFEAYLARIGVTSLAELSPAILSAFVVERKAKGFARTTVREMCGILRVFLRYAKREKLLPVDLSDTVEWPQAYRLATLPRSITWHEVRQVLDQVDRRSATGKRDYAILLLLVTYGLRGREVAALTLDDIDWKRERLRIPERKAGHSTAYPLSTVVGNALVDYLQHGRPTTVDRHIFL